MSPYKQASWRSGNRNPEPTLREILDEPIVQALMERDGVDRRVVETMLEPRGRHLTS